MNKKEVLTKIREDLSKLGTKELKTLAESLQEEALVCEERRREFNTLLSPYIMFFSKRKKTQND